MIFHYLKVLTFEQYIFSTFNLKLRLIGKYQNTTQPNEKTGSLHFDKESGEKGFWAAISWTELTSELSRGRTEIFRCGRANGYQRLSRKFSPKSYLRAQVLRPPKTFVTTLRSALSSSSNSSLPRRTKYQRRSLRRPYRPSTSRLRYKSLGFPSTSRPVRRAPMSTKGNRRSVMGLALSVGLLTLWQNRVKKQSTLEQSGLSEEELLRQQQELFKSATDKFNSGPADST